MLGMKCVSTIDCYHESWKLTFISEEFVMNELIMAFKYLLTKFVPICKILNEIYKTYSYSYREKET